MIVFPADSVGAFYHAATNRFFQWGARSSLPHRQKARTAGSIAGSSEGRAMI